MLALAWFAQPLAAQVAANPAPPADGGFKVIATAAAFKTSAARKKEYNEILQLLREGPLDTVNRSRIETFLRQVVFAEWTQPTFRPQLAKLRLEFRNKELRQISAADDAKHAFINDVTLKGMIAIANDNYHPAVRHNAMMLIGDLNAKEAGTGAMATPAEPLPQALTEKGALLESAENAQLPPAVRVAALIGILRHAENGAKMQPPTKESIRAAMVRVLKEKKPAENTSPDGHAWLRMRAADVLGVLALPGADNESAKELAKVIDEADAPLMLRCAAARSLGRLKLGAAADLKVAEIAGALGNLTLEVCSAELARSEAANESPSARTLGHRTVCIQVALKGEDDKGGIGALKAEGNDKTVLDGVSKTVLEIAGSFDHADAATDIKPKVEELEKLLAQHKLLRAKPAAPAATAVKPEAEAEAGATPAAADAKTTDAKAAAAPAAAKK
jgi:hypothetical protein